MNRSLWPILFLILPLTINAGDQDKMNRYQKEAEEVGHLQLKGHFQAIKQNLKNDPLFNGKQQTFDPLAAKEKVESAQRYDTELTQFLISPAVQQNLAKQANLNPDDYIFKHAEEITSGKEEETFLSEQYHLETCQQANSAFPVHFIKTLQVKPAMKEITSIKKCQGHHKKKTFFWKTEAKEWSNKKEQQLAKDPTIKKYDIHYQGGLTAKYVVKAEWTHQHNTETCDHFVLEEKETHIQEIETWLIDQPDKFASVSQDINSTFIGKTCIDSAPRVIDGLKLNKPCWKEKWSFLCQLTSSSQCAFLKEKNCLEVKRVCLQPTEQGCAVWQLTYKCFDRLKRERKATGEPDAFFDLEKDTSYTPNTSFSSVITKLKVFEEINTQLKEAPDLDIKEIKLFDGKQFTCSKNIADQLLYDCCFSFKGLAQKLKLSQCSAEEIELSTLRDKHLCHYVGHYEEKFLELWKSRHNHVFCCFPSKLARLFQEQARQQLGQDWGTAEQPTCQGLLVDQIHQIDFTALDLTEAIELNLPDIESKLKQKLKGIQQDLQNQPDQPINRYPHES